MRISSRKNVCLWSIIDNLSLTPPLTHVYIIQAAEEKAKAETQAEAKVRVFACGWTAFLF